MQEAAGGAFIPNQLNNMLRHMLQIGGWPLMKSVEFH
jgi:hypothetical protein